MWMNCDCTVVRNEVLLCSVIDPVILTFDIWTPKQYHLSTSMVSQGHSYTECEHFGIIHFWVVLRTNKQADKQTDSKIQLRVDQVRLFVPCCQDTRTQIVDVLGFFLQLSCLTRFFVFTKVFVAKVFGLILCTTADDNVTGTVVRLTASLLH